tara:strand:+ start:77 stop:502 length:426 start_codon:yes stop_codon:yes gene_type:complete
MKITKQQLKQIIKEEIARSEALINEMTLGGVSSALGAMAGRPEPAMPVNTPDSEIQRKAADFFTNLVITDKVVAVLVNNIATSDLKIIMSKIPKIDTADQEDVFTEENNPWAICTAQVGREDKEKYEKCVKSVKKQNGGKE